MPKNVFNPVEIVDLTSQKVKVAPPVFEKDVPEPEDVYEGPSVMDLQREAQNFRNAWEEEKERMLQNARDEAEQIRKQAELTAFEEVKLKTDEAIRDKRYAQDEAQRIQEEAKQEADALRKQAEVERENVFSEAREEARIQGHEEGWKEGQDEVDRLINRFHKIIDVSIEKRQEIVNETESQIIELVLLIARKVIKVVSENQKNVVINNIVQALRKIKSRGEVTVRVNLSDLEMTTNHIKDFIDRVEKVKSVSVLEDSSIEKGGAVIETDFGLIDARISSQLRQIEERILELSPISVNEEY